VFGSHLSIAGSLAGALREAESLKLETVQVFTKNQQQWKFPPLDDETVRQWRAELSRLGWEGRTVSHASYLINLASPERRLWRKSILMMREEVDRCEKLGIAYLVHHPGSFTTSTHEEGMGRIVEAVSSVLEQTRGYATTLCLENVAGAGSHLGRAFEELASLRARIVERAGAEAERRVGFCFDTCHAHAAGYDMSSREAAERSLAEFDRVCGLANMRVLHLNDSVGALGSRLDRHAHIGKGEIGLAGFAAVVNHPALRSPARPMIMETPKGQTKAGTNFDTLNLRRLRRLVENHSPVGPAPAAPAVTA
jgi:deoxyribonuclease-4